MFYCTFVEYDQICVLPMNVTNKPFNFLLLFQISHYIKGKRMLFTSCNVIFRYTAHSYSLCNTGSELGE